jgi:hypothetical protein
MPKGLKKTIELIIDGAWIAAVFAFLFTGGSLSYNLKILSNIQYASWFIITGVVFIDASAAGRRKYSNIYLFYFFFVSLVILNMLNGSLFWGAPKLAAMLIFPLMAVISEKRKKHAGISAMFMTYWIIFNALYPAAAHNIVYGGTGSENITEMLDNLNIYAFVIAGTFPVKWLLVSELSDKGQWFFRMLLILSDIIAMVFTHSAAGSAILAVMIVVLSRPSLSDLRIIALLTALAAGIIILDISYFQKMTTSQSLLERRIMLDRALLKISENPLYGAGSGKVNLVNFSEEDASMISDRTDYHTVMFAFRFHLHNSLLTLIYESGILILPSLIMLLMYPAVNSMKMKSYKIQVETAVYFLFLSWLLVDDILFFPFGWGLLGLIYPETQEAGIPFASLLIRETATTEAVHL